MSSRELFPLKKKSNASVSFISVHQKNNNTVKLETYWESQLSIIPDKKNIVIPYEKIPIIPKKISVFLYFDDFIVLLLMKKTNLLLHTQQKCCPSPKKGELEACQNTVHKLFRWFFLSMFTRETKLLWCIQVKITVM